MGGAGHVKQGDSERWEVLVTPSYLGNHQIEFSLKVTELAKRGNPGVKQLVQTIEAIHYLRDL